jgi:hypothetical protein
MVDGNRQWENTALDHVLTAVANWPGLCDALVFKGARILHHLLATGRQSYDIDCNLRASVAQVHATPEAQERFLKDEVRKALERYFDRMSPSRYDLADIQIRRIPQDETLSGWYFFRISLKVTDAKRPGVKALPLLVLDVASPEPLSGHAMAEITVSGKTVLAYTLSRIAGEKLRAYLSSLPTYCNKVKKTDRTIRHKDLYDLAKIVRAEPPTILGFWPLAAEDFRLACEARLVDCVGLTSFREAWDKAKAYYEADTSLEDVSFQEAEESLERVVTVFEELAVFPLTFSMRSVRRD